MNPETRELLSRYLDGDLDAAGREAADRELRRPGARRELERMARLRGAVRRLAAAEHPPPALDRLVEPLRHAPPPRPFWRAPGALAAAAAVAVTGALAALLPRPGPPPGPPRPVHRTAPGPSSTPFVLGETPRLAGAGEGMADRVAAARPSVPEPEAGATALVIEGPLPPGGSVLRLDGAEVPLPGIAPPAAAETVEVEVRDGRVVTVRRAPARVAPALEGLEVPGAPDGVCRGTVEPLTPSRSGAGSGGR